MAIRKLLDEISVIPGVTGSCIFDKNEGPICTNSDANIATDVLMKVGSYLLRMLKIGKMNGMEIIGSHYRFDNCTVVSTPLGTSSILLTICDTKANCSLVATTAAMLAADMEEQLKSDAATLDIDELPDIDAPDMEEVEPDDVKLQKYFTQLEEALAVAIGPVAGIVTQDYIVKWQQQGPATVARLPELITMLSEEISDENLVNEFVLQANQILP